MPELAFRVFGPVRAVRDGIDANLQTPGVQAALAVLLLKAGRTATTAELVDALWERPPRTSQNLVRTYISRLRRDLGSDVIDRVPRGYRLQLADDAVDLDRFETLCRRARVERDAHDDAAATDTLRSALRLSGQPPLVGVPGPFADIQRTLLGERRLDVLEECLDVEVGLGRPGEVIGELQAAAAAHPLRERLVRVTMTALHELGRTAEALDLYHHTRRLLRDDAGMDPGQELQACYSRLLQRDGADPGVRRRPERQATRTPAPRFDLPPATRVLHGRDRELAELTSPTAGTIASIDGMGGVGKTALAIRAAGRMRDACPDGAVLLDLRAHSDGARPLPVVDALATLLRAMGGDPDLRSDVDELAAGWRALMSDRRIVLVLDNAVDSAHVRPLLPGGDSRVIVTSRRRLLTLAADTVVSLSTLGEDDAVAVLRGVVGNRVEHEPDAARELAQACGGLPLALQLAGARLRHRPTWAVGDLVDRLRTWSGMADLKFDGSDVGAALGLSMDQLDEVDLAVLRTMARLPVGNFGAPIAAAVSGLPVSRMRRRLEDLLDRHLLVQQRADHYRLHDLARSYLRRRYGDGDSAFDAAEGAIGRALLHYVHSAVAAATAACAPQRAPIIDAEVTRPELTRHLADRAVARRWLEDQAGSIPQVIEFGARTGFTTLAWQLAGAASGFFDRTGRAECLGDAYRAALAAAVADGDDRAQAHLLRLLGKRACMIGDYEAGAAHAGAAVEVSARAVEARALPPPVVSELSAVQARALVTGAAALAALGHYSAAAGRLARASELAWHDPTVVPLVSLHLAELNLYTGRYEHATEAGRDGLIEAERIGDRRVGAIILRAVGEVLLAKGEPANARRVLQEARAHAAAVDDSIFEGLTIVSLAATRTAAGDAAAAARLLAEAEARVDGHWDESDRLDVVIRSGDMHSCAGDTDAALDRYRAALEMTERLKTPRGRARAHFALARSLTAAGRPDVAGEHLADARIIAARYDLPQLEAEVGRAVG